MPATVNLTYTSAKSEFTIKATGVKNVSYTLEYQAQKGSETITEALTGKGNATGSAYTATHLAGTQSGGATVPHTVKGGALKLTATTTENAPLTFEQLFTISSTGQLKTISQSQEVGLAGSVLGVSTDYDVLTPPASGSTRTVPTSTVPTPVATITPRTTVPDPQTTTQEPTTSDGLLSALQLDMPKLAIGGGLLAILLLSAIALWWSRRQPANNIPNQPLSPPAGT